MQNIWTNRSLSDEEKALFNFYGIRGYDCDAMKTGMTDEQIATVMEQNRQELNEILPAYEKISQIRIYHEEFEKTPKKSIKRFLYQKE